jgi:hypothetical protein
MMMKIPLNDERSDDPPLDKESPIVLMMKIPLNDERSDEQHRSSYNLHYIYL